MAEEKEQQCFRDDYHDKFDVDSFLTQYYHSAEDGGLHSFYLSHYYKFVQDYWSKESFTTPYNILDFGSGPSPWHFPALFSSPLPLPSLRLYLTDYSTKNMETLVKWIKNESKHDWTTFYVSAVSQNEPKVKELGKEEKERVVNERMEGVKGVVEGVWGCDAVGGGEELFSSSPFFCTKGEKGEGFPEGFSLITTNLCLEAACKTEEEYGEAIRKIAKYLLPGGWLCMSIVLNETYYKVGKDNFFCLPLTMEKVKEKVEKAGLKMVVGGERGVGAEGEDGADMEGLGFVIARKV